VKTLAATPRAIALLYVLVAIAPAEPGEPWPSLSWTWPGVLREPAFGCLVVLGTIELAWGLRWAWRSVRWIVRASWRAWATLHPRRGFVGRWLHLSFFEPPTAPDQAREALAKLCGYRLQGPGYRIDSIRPGLRRGRFGVWVTVVHPSRHSRWQCGYVRWITDPNELWLLRSALRPGAEPAPVSQGARTTGELDGMSGDEMDRLLRAPATR
jgi:hypothetical protein